MWGMHGCTSASVLVVNAEVDSMGGVVEGGVGIANRTSPQKLPIEKVQAELRQEYGVRDERKRELEFLEKGGNPLDFKLGFVASVSVQSTSVTDQHPDQFVISEAKGSFAFTASPHGDSVESSGRPGTTHWEPNSADNLMLFDAENEVSEGGRSVLHRSNVVPSEQSVQMDGGRKTLEHGDSAAFVLPRKAYKRRYRSRPNRDGARSSSTDVNPARGCGDSLPSHHGSGNAKGLTSDAENQNISSDRNSMPTSPTNEILPKTIVTDGQDDLELDGLKSFQSTKDQIQGVPLDTVSDAIASKNPPDEQLNQQSLSATADTPKQMESNGPEAIQTEELTSAVVECQPSAAATKVENQSISCQMNGFGRKRGDDMMTDGHNARGTKVLDSESSCTQVSISIDGNNNSEVCTRGRHVDSNGNLENQTVQDGTPVIESDKFAKEKKDAEVIDSSTLVDKEDASACQSQGDNDASLLLEKESDQKESAFENKVNNQVIIEEMEATGATQLESGMKPADSLVDNPGLLNETSSDVRHQHSIDASNSDIREVGLLTGVSAVSPEAQTSESDSKLASKIDEDSILKEAQIIEAKRKRIAELSVVTSPVEIRRKSHWDYVLEEMAWLANDFAQERIWKAAAASQICYQVAVARRLRKQEKNCGVDAKRVAHTLAKAIMEFWHSVEFQVQETGNELEQQHQKNGALSVRAYAVRFLKCNQPNISHNPSDMPLTPDRISDLGVMDLSWEDSLTEENLFYTIPPGAMETYRMTIESHVAQCERIGSTVQEEVETSACGAAAEFEYQDNAYDEDEGETNTYNMPVAFEGSKSSRYGQKKQKHLTHAYGARSHEMGSDLLPMQCVENKVVNPQFALLAKRPGNSLNASIPTKRMRTASRRVISPFGAGASGYIPIPNKTDASSCDTNSFQDDQSTLRGGLLVTNSSEVDSAGEYEKELPFDSAEVSMKPKKKKKAKHLYAAYEQRWQVDSSFQNEQFQRDHLQMRSESYQLESNGNSGLLGQPIAKKPKLMRQSQDNSFDNIPPSGGSVPSPVGSQISNMSNPNKFMKMLGGRDRGRKAKALKMPCGQLGSGSPWSLFEDQALVVLAHDLGPNWELVSDAFNSTLHFKCIFRKANECKERHIVLMDRTSADGADSAEDSGSSQPYPSTLPGIPKGSARQLFQRLQGPMEEETLKSHFEKIIMIGQKQHYRKTQEPKQFQQPHSSHTIALSQACPNNLNGGPVLTPLDLCDASISGPDLLPPGYQGTHSSALAIPNQVTVNQMLPASAASSALLGTSNMMIGNSFPSSPGPLNPSARDVRYVVPRSGSLSADEHQRMHLYNQMIPGRNIPQSNISAPGALPGNDRGARVPPTGNGMGLMSGVNRSMPMARPGFQGIPSSSMVNSGSVVSPGMSSANMHAGVGAAQGSSIVRPREALPLMRPGLTQDSQRQVMAPDLQVPGNGQGVSHFGGLSSPFPNQTASTPVSSYPLHHQSSHPISSQQSQVLAPHQPHFPGPANHASNPQQQAYAIRLAKERQLHHRFLQQQQQQQQYAASNALMPHVQSQPQLPMSSPMQNSSQVQSQTSAPPVSLPPLTSSPSMNAMPQHQQKHQMPTQGVARNAQAGGIGLTNQTGKQRQRQQHQLSVSQANRQHPQQRQQLQTPQQAKVVKGVGRGNLMMHQNIATDVSLSNGVSTNLGNQSLEKGEPTTNSMQSQSLYTGSAQNSVQPTRPYMASQCNQPLPQHKMYPGQASPSSRHLQPTSKSDNSSQGHVPPVAPPVLSAGHQSNPSLAIPVSNNQAASHQKKVNQHQSVLQRLVQPNRQINSDPLTRPQGRDSDADHHPASSSTEMDRMVTLPQASNNASNTVQHVSPPSTHKWHASEPLNSPSNLSSLAAMPSNSSESVPQAGQGLGQRPSTSLPLTRHDASAQWQQQQQSQPPQTPLPQSQQHQQPLPPLHSQQQAQLLQAESGNLYGRSSDSRLE